MKLCIEVTQQCNLTCDWCMTRETSEESLSIGYIIEQIDRLGVTKLLLSGGEPLLRRDIVDMIFAIRERYPSIFISVSTHGLFHKRMLDLSTLVNRYDISLPTLNQGTYTLMRGGGDILKVMQSIEALRHIPSLHLRLTHMITSKNREDWRQVLNWANGRVASVRLTQFWPFRQAYGVWEKYRISDFELEEQLQLVRQEAYDFNIIWPRYIT
jgi:cyclic pyranopterin phosphate synthase